MTHIGQSTGGTYNGKKRYDLKESGFTTGSAGATYNSNSIINIKESIISSYFGVKEGSIVGEDDNVDEIAEAINGVSFFDNIYVGDDNKYHVSGITGKGVRYYLVQRTGLNELFKKLNGQGEIGKGKALEQTNWRSALSYVTNGTQLYVDEVTDNLTDALYYDYENPTAETNNNLNVNKKNNFNHIIGVYDVYTNLNGNKNIESDYRDEMLDAWSVVPKHTNLLSIVRLYKIQTTSEGNYNDGFFYPKP